MRRLLTAFLVVSVVGTVGWRHSADLDALADTFKLKIAGADGKAAGNLPVVISTGAGGTTELGMTSANGDLEIATDPNKRGKKFNVYRQSCTPASARIIMHEQGTPEDRACQSKSTQENPKDECGSCVLLGWFSHGENAAVGQSGGMGTAGKATLAVVTTAAGGYAISRANQSNGPSTGTTPGGTTTVAPPPIAAPNPFVSLDGTYPNVTFLLQSGSCAGFNPQFTGTITVTGHSSEGATVTVRIVESITREYRGLIRNGTFEGTGNGAFGSGRTWIGQLSALLSGGSARTAREVLNVGASATSAACTNTYVQQ